MSVTKVSKTEHLLNTFVELRSLCYSKERIKEERLQLTGNHLLQCDNIMQQMLKDLNVPRNETGGDKDGPVMQRIVKNLGIFEREILGTESVVARSLNVENIIVHVETVKNRMSYNSNYFCTIS